jgi:serine/threonine protein kinase/formylglycine-generating enzyme required for sulfatase activity/dienelactone hydrolase
VDAYRWTQIQLLYHAAVELAPSARAAFLSQTCPDDPELRREVESLLAHVGQADPLLENPEWKRVRASEPSLETATKGSRRVVAGSQVGEFRIVEFLGAGGMGEVYRATDTRLHRDVAIKMLPPEFADRPDWFARFRREARALAALNHSHICALHDVGPNYLVMELLDGQTLAARIKNGALPIGEALQIAIEIAGALREAHGKGIVHRDLKPGNIMLTGGGAKLLDFGLAQYRQPAAPEETITASVTGEALLVGTVQYMSPEQTQGKAVDARSDIFSFGLVLYEMLTGRRAFQRDSTIDVIVAVQREEPKPLREFIKDVPGGLERIVHRCLRKAPEERYPSFTEIASELEDCRSSGSEPASGINFKVLLRQSRRPIVALPLLAVLLALGGLSARLILHSYRATWARNQVLPQIEKLIEREDETGRAYVLAVEAERYIPDDPVLRKFWPEISISPSIRTTPPGASVYRRDYDHPHSAWEFVGRTPIEKRRMPLVHTQWKFELKGFATVERATFPSPGDPFMVAMVDESKAPPGMVRIVSLNPADPAGAPFRVSLAGLSSHSDLPAVPLEDYWIDKYEVTNAQFKQFLDQGGYRKQEYWKQEFRQDGQALPWPKAVAMLRDATGRPGPATWVQGEYPRGQEGFPVSGVSWYEAAAYAEFAGKVLPTIYHWGYAASAAGSANSKMVPASNFGGQGPARVGSYGGMSRFGTYDMAGNVKEWCWNEAGEGKRYILGGAWDEPTYTFNDADARSPFQRSANFGFRCARYVSERGVGKAGDQVTLRARDFNREKPASDQLFRIYKSLYSYDKTPLNAVVESTERTADWKREKITFAAAYGNERVIAYLFLPLKASPPFQTVVYFPGAFAVYYRNFENGWPSEEFDFLIKSGRAVMFPVYKSTYERGDGLDMPYPNTSNSYRDHVIAWSKDLGRSIDYLETRPEIDTSKLAYEGWSWGAAMASVMVAVEDRIRVCLLISPGFRLQECLPEVDDLNFAPHATVPVLMLNGRYDYIWPGPTSQEPMFRLLGTPIGQKRRVVYDTGHGIPQNEVIKESLNWLDRYFGPVK